MCVSPQKGNPFPYAAESDVLSDSHLAVNDNITPSNFLSKYSPPRSSARFSPSLPPCCVGEPAHFVGSRGAARRGRYVVWWWGVSVMPLWSGTCALCGAVVGCVGDATVYRHLHIQPSSFHIGRLLYRPSESRSLRERSHWAPTCRPSNTRMSSARSNVVYHTPAVAVYGGTPDFPKRRL